MKSDVAVGLLVLAIAAAYYYFTRDIPRSLLSDQVGADGLPKLYATALGLLGILLIGKAFAARAEPGGSAGSSGATLWQHARALGLLVLGAAYLLLIGSLGYLLTLLLLIAAVAIYAGAAPSLRLLWISAAGGVVFWLVFVQLFGMPLPAGTLWQRLAG